MIARQEITDVLKQIQIVSNSVKITLSYPNMVTAEDGRDF